MRRRRAAAAGLLLVAATAAGCSEDEQSVEGFCDQLDAAASFDDALTRLDPDELADAFGDVEALADVAPPEIADEVAELRDAAGAIVATVATAVGDPVDAAEDALRAQGDRAAQVERAGRAVERYAAAECDVDLVDGTSTTVAEPPAAPPSVDTTG